MPLTFSRRYKLSESRYSEDPRLTMTHLLYRDHVPQVLAEHYETEADPP